MQIWIDWVCTWKTGKRKIGQYTSFDWLTSKNQWGKCAEEKVAKNRQMMEFCHSHLTHNIFSYCMRRFFFGLVYVSLGLNWCILQTSKTQVWPGLILAWSGFKLFDNHGVTRIWGWTVVFCCIYDICLNDDNLYKQFRPRSGLAECWPELDTNFLMKYPT